ncbi:hypothetical protein GCM10025794_34410 [Massilia kyonggiensis]
MSQPILVAKGVDRGGALIPIRNNAQLRLRCFQRRAEKAY